MTPEAIETVYREERSRILATLIRWSRNIDDAEEVLQDAFTKAASRWPSDGLPNNPAAWILEIAKHRLVDIRRVESRRSELLSQLIVDNPTPEELPDDILRLIFTCCHPVLSPESQIALTLRTLGGLATPEIARAFLLPEPTIAQRIVRAKAKISNAGIPYRVPDTSELPQRLDSLLAVLYLIFNEGYSTLRPTLATEAIHLASQLNTWLPAQAEVEGLLALMLLIHSRCDARTAPDGSLITLDQQDRTLWHQTEIKAGITLVEQALKRKQLGPYQLQAAIAGVHAESTDWPQIERLYAELLRFDNTPVVRLNHAIAVSYSCGWQQGLDLLNAIEGLDNYHPWHAARAQFLRHLGRFAEARAAFDRAIRLAPTRAEREYPSRIQAPIQKH
ncbi:MAG: RNA polymerase sigma factor [Acidobacteria bacterium]|nr:RNA polymerase sigma factor [Acidobacteriota bacterium]